MAGNCKLTSQLLRRGNPSSPRPRCPRLEKPGYRHAPHGARAKKAVATTEGQHRPEAPSVSLLGPYCQVALRRQTETRALSSPSMCR